MADTPLNPEHPDSPNTRGIPYERNPAFDPLPSTGYAPASPIGPAIDGFYLSAHDVKRVAHYGHFIPAGRGWTRDFMHKNFPGWSWGELMWAIRSSGLYRPNDGHGGKLDPSYVGLVVTRTEVFPDDGTLEHPLKTAYVPRELTH